MSKSTGKKLFTIAGFFLGAGGWGQSAFGMTNSIASGLYGASLAGTIWSATHKPKSSSYKFDAAKNTIDNNAMIPIIYGTRKWSGGLLTWQNIYSSYKKQRRDIILCEGEVERITGVTANCALISEGVIFCISNIVYSDATVKILKTNSPTQNDKRLTLYANGVTTNINLQGTGDIANDNSNEHSCYIQKLCQYIEKLGNGWIVSNNAGTDGNPEDIYDLCTTTTTIINYLGLGEIITYTYNAIPCYRSPVDVTAGGIKYCNYSAYTGSSTQSPPTNYESVGSYKNCAYIRAYLEVGDNLQGTNPNISAIIKGRKIYDTRTSTTAYSENPAMCLRDYILCKRFGMGRWITADMLDEDSFKEAADYCDEEISYVDAYDCTVTEPRYSLNLIIAEQRKHMDNIQDILAVFGGFLVVSGDKLSLHIEKQDSISYAFNESNIKVNSVKADYAEISECPNRYAITYYDPAQNWVGIKVLVEDTADQYQRGQIISKEVSLSGCTSQGQALRLGRLYKAINRLSGVIVTFTTGTMAMHLQPGDIISFSYRTISGQPLRILEISENKGEWTIKGQQYNSSIYDDRLGAQITVGNYTNSSNALTSAIPEVFDVTLAQNYYKQSDGIIVSEIIVNYTLPGYEFLDRIIVDTSIDGGTTWYNVGYTKESSYVIHNALVGKDYSIRLRVQNTASRISTGVITT